MSLDDVVTLMRTALFTVIELAAPVLLVSLVIGLLISIFQTVTSIQEQTLTFVPKVICVFLGLMIMGHWMLTTLKDYIISLWGNFAQYIH
ncbi:MAG: flagellar biosynthesis protein FliQ [Lachnospiraceae bacterium]|nr:flagellar biosynthesis protein FliQ [Lachnospiraceae bacterium]